MKPFGFYNQCSITANEKFSYREIKCIFLWIQRFLDFGFLFWIPWYLHFLKFQLDFVAVDLWNAFSSCEFFNHFHKVMLYYTLLKTCLVNNVKWLSPSSGRPFLLHNFNIILKIWSFNWYIQLLKLKLSKICKRQENHPLTLTRAKHALFKVCFLSKENRRGRRNIQIFWLTFEVFFFYLAP